MSIKIDWDHVAQCVSVMSSRYPSFGYKEWMATIIKEVEWQIEQQSEPEQTPFDNMSSEQLSKLDVIKIHAILGDKRMTGKDIADRAEETFLKLCQTEGREEKIAVLSSAMFRLAHDASEHARDSQRELMVGVFTQVAQSVQKKMVRRKKR